MDKNSAYIEGYMDKEGGPRLRALGRLFSKLPGIGKYFQPRTEVGRLARSIETNPAFKRFNKVFNPTIEQKAVQAVSRHPYRAAAGGTGLAGVMGYLLGGREEDTQKPGLFTSNVPARGSEGWLSSERERLESLGRMMPSEESVQNVYTGIIDPEVRVKGRDIRRKRS